MWAALVRQVAVFLFTKRGKRIMIFLGLAALCFLTALLTDSRMYLTAAVTGAFTAILMIALVAGYFGQRAKQRRRAYNEAEQAVRRAAASQARHQKFGKAKSAVTGAAKTASDSAIGAVRRAGRGFADAGRGLAGAAHRLTFWRGRKRKTAHVTHRSHLPR